MSTNAFEIFPLEKELVDKCSQFVERFVFLKIPFRDALSVYFMLTELEIDHFSIHEVKTVLVLLL